MKVCPVCRAVAFDDATVCYGCLHDFAREGEDREPLPTSGVPLNAEELPADGAFVNAGELQANEVFAGNVGELSSGETPAGNAGESLTGEPSMGDGNRARPSGAFARASAPQHARDPAAAEFTIRFTPVFDQSGGFAWTCAVEA